VRSRTPTAGWAGVTATAGGVVFSADHEGTFIVADSASAKKSYEYPTDRRSSRRRRPSRSKKAVRGHAVGQRADDVRAAEGEYRNTVNARSSREGFRRATSA